MGNFLAHLILVKGSIQEGFTTLLQISEDNQKPFFQIAGELPPAIQLLKNYDQWQSAFYSQTPRKLKTVVGLENNISIVTSSSLLTASLNDWLNCEAFRPSKEALLMCLSPRDSVRLLVQSTDDNIWKLPWHLWDFCDRYPFVEVALSLPTFSKVSSSKTSGMGVKILAILGDDTGINLNKDQEVLNQWPDAEAKIIIEPSREEVTYQLWENHYDILFFAGHSSTRNQTGTLHINRNESLTIDELRPALKRSITCGLQQAIFNSCDGLGLARALSDLNIPQMIVMREPVPDFVAQEFLKYFLNAFSRSKLLTFAATEARERLQSLEHCFPCASWLPAIFENPAVESRDVAVPISDKLRL